MFKEMIISILIVISIVALDLVTQNYAEQSINGINGMLKELETQIHENNLEYEKTINKIFEYWDKRHGKLAYFIEHDELEKVETNLINARDFIKVKDFNMAINSIGEAEFVLEHIQDKNAFSLENIF